MSEVRRLPTQHRDRPHCTSCSAKLPSPRAAARKMPELFAGLKPTRVVLIVRFACPSCGVELEMEQGWS